MRTMQVRHPPGRAAGQRMTYDPGSRYSTGGGQGGRGAAGGGHPTVECDACRYVVYLRVCGVLGGGATGVRCGAGWAMRAGVCAGVMSMQWVGKRVAITPSLRG